MPEACLRCGGKGVVIYRVGYPGQDQRLIPPAEIRWRKPIEKRCPVCLGMKIKQPKRNYPPPRTEIYWNTPLTEQERAELFTTEVPPDHVYEQDEQ